jgi:lipooligosaccharide transport system permease protein
MAPGLALRITPLAVLGGRYASRVLERNLLVYRRSWIFILSGFFEPLFYLLSIGIGLSHLVGPIPVNGRLFAYTAFVAPGLLASSAMNGAMIDSTFLVFMKLKIAKTYDAMLATPLSVGDVALGELSWCVIRGSLYSGAFLSIMAALGYVVSPWAALCWPAAILVSLAFASAGMAGTTYMRTWQDFDIVSLAFIPLFLFSATFYPLTVFPGWLQAVVRCTPLYQGVVLVRAADLGLFNWVLLLHVAYLLAMAMAGVAITRRRLGRLLLP